MAIEGFTKEKFIDTLSEYISVSEPIGSIEHLFGRADELARIEKALYIPGRHIFIYGDRGVGKSSLAATAANQYQSADKPYVDIGCGPDSTLYSVVANIVYQAIEADRIYNRDKTRAVGFQLHGMHISKTENITSKDIKSNISDLSDAVEFLRQAAEIHSDKPVVVIDEFDRISDANERALFADLIKQLGDKRIHIKFIFTGVAQSLEELIGAHASAVRQLETIELPRLSINGRWEILKHAAKAFGLTVNREVEVRVALVSDGFPYYVHLLSNNILWRVFEEEKIQNEIRWDHYVDAIRGTIESVDVELKEPYEKAVKQRNNEYEHVLWGTADSEYLDRYVDDMFLSYKWIAQQVDGHVLTKNQFYNRIKNLQKEAFGEILVSSIKRGLYTYREKMIRGYVRLQAEAHGIELRGEIAKEPKRETVRAPVSLRKGYHASTVPKGVGLKGDKKKEKA